MSEPIMNLLQSFMGCMYPGSIRTDSIESVNDISEHIYVVKNIDERGNVVSRGELHVTDKDLLYYRPGRFPTRWPVDLIRRFGCSDEGIFSFEAGRRCQTGQAIFAFRCDYAEDLKNRLVESINNRPLRDQNDQHREVNQADYKISAKASTQHSSPRSCFEAKRLPCDKKDAATATDNDVVNPNEIDSSRYALGRELDPRPLGYALIDFDSTKALSETFQAHAASRPK